MQEMRAAECEASTGPASRPTLGRGGTAADGQGDEDEEDPLDAFMAEMHAVGATEAPPAKRARHAVEVFEEADHIADFMEARKRGGSGSSGASGAQAAAMAAAAAVAARAGEAGYGSDEEVYAAARAMEGAMGGGLEYDDDDNVIGVTTHVHAFERVIMLWPETSVNDQPVPMIGIHAYYLPLTSADTQPTHTPC
jgi:hypothetical protein